MKFKLSFTKEVWKGLGLALICNFINFSVSALIFMSSFGICGPYGIRADIGGVLTLGWGLTQFIYLGPMIFLARRKGKQEFARRLMYGACVSVIANVGTCAFLWPILGVFARAVDWFEYCFGIRK